MAFPTEAVDVWDCITGVSTSELRFRRRKLAEYHGSVLTDAAARSFDRREPAEHAAGLWAHRSTEWRRNRQAGSRGSINNRRPSTETQFEGFDHGNDFCRPVSASTPVAKVWTLEGPLGFFSFASFISGAAGMPGFGRSSSSSAIRALRCIVCDVDGAAEDAETRQAKGREDAVQCPSQALLPGRGVTECTVHAHARLDERVPTEIKAVSEGWVTPGQAMFDGDAQLTLAAIRDGPLSCKAPDELIGQRGLQRLHVAATGLVNAVGSSLRDVDREVGGVEEGASAQETRRRGGGGLSYCGMPVSAKAAALLSEEPRREGLPGNAFDVDGRSDVACACALAVRRRPRPARGSRLSRERPRSCLLDTLGPLGKLLATAGQSRC
ncbi:hypothetical protein CSOJ01_05738 [Colletotrichum sojae]|uniref:Uncharacterized protein n=1 Tax=Colletotrichum sojae TaxID=2175907 RepID=A0A8H6JF38_9PEZI|nr:hypothetical protein CSOJ01_05738 [Colletotrichum sojae]